VALAAFAAVFSKPARGIATQRFAPTAGFLLAGALGTVIGAFGLSEGNGPVWTQSAFSYGLPALLAAIVAFIIGAVHHSDSEKSEKMTGMVIAYLVLAVAVVFGSIGSSMDEYYSDDEAIFSDPLMKGFAAIEEKYPARWSELKEEIRFSELSGTGSLPVIITAFFHKNQAEFFRLASDKAAIDFQKHAINKMEYLSTVDPESCVSLINGHPTDRVTKSLSYELKLQEAEALESLIKSSGTGNSGTAFSEEAEAVFVSTLFRFADEHPEAFLIYLSFANGESQAPSSVCETWIALNKVFEQRPDNEYARFIRSDLWLDPETEISEAAESEISLAHLYADAALTRRGLPQKLDAITTLTNVLFQDRVYRFIYQLDGQPPTSAQLKSYFEETSLGELCTDEYYRTIIDNSVTFSYEYEHSDGRVVLLLDSNSCETGAMRLME